MFGSLFGKKKDTFASPFTGTLCSITETPDEAFAEKMNGDGFMVQPADGDNTGRSVCGEDERRRLYGAAC